MLISKPDSGGFRGTQASNAPSLCAQERRGLGAYSPSLATQDRDGVHVTAGAVDPAIANNLLAAGSAVLIDVRTAEELKQVGLVPGSIHVAWQLGAAMTKNPRFLKELSLKVSPDTVLLFICRSGKRSADAALAALKAGYIHSYNVLEGVEGTDDSGADGWRNRGLPWSPGQTR